MGSGRPARDGARRTTGRRPWRSGRAAPTRWARRSTGAAPTSRSSARSPSRSSCACSTTRGAETRVEMTEVDALRLALLPADGPARPALRLPGARPVRPRARGCAATRTSCCSTRTPRPPSATIDWDQSLFGYDFGDPDSRNDDDSGAAHDARRRHQPVLRLGGRPRASNIPYNETRHLRGARQGPHRAAPRRPRGACAAPTPALAHPAVIDHLTRLGVTAIELMPVHQFVQDSTLLDKGLRNYWGYNTLGFFAPHADYAAAGRASASRCRSSSRWCKALHAAGIEVILDVVYNHTAEGNHLGPTLSFKGIDNPAYYRLVEDDQRYYMDYTGTGNSLNVRHPHSLQLIMDSLRYWVTEMHVDGFRFDLAAALAREFYDVDRLSTFFELVQQDPVVSPGEADRRAVGRRPRRLPGRQLPAAVDRVERQVPRHRPRLLARRAVARRVRLPARRLLRPLRALRPAPGREHQLRHRARRLHAARPGVLQREAQRRQRRGQQRRREPQPVLELRRRGADRRPRDPRRCGPAQQRNFLATLLLSQGVPMLAARRRAGPHPGGQQQHLRPGLRDHLDALGRRRRAAGRVHRGGRPAAPRPPDVPPQPLLHRHDRCAPARASGSTTSSGCTPTAGRWRTATGTQRRAGDRHVPQRPRHRRRRRPRPARSSTTTSCSTSTPTATASS